MRKYHTISTAAARELILSQRVNGRGCMFSVAWDRRTRSSCGGREKGEREIITGRFGVRKHLAGNQAPRLPGSDWPINIRSAGCPYNRHDHGLFCFFAMSRKYHGETSTVWGYRAIPFDEIRWLKLDGTVYKVGKAPPPQI